MFEQSNQHLDCPLLLNAQEFKSKLGVLVRKLRLHKGIASDKLCVDYTTVNQIENGHINPRVYTLYKLLTNIDVDIDSLLTEKQQEQISTEEQQKSLVAFLNKFEIRKNKQNPIKTIVRMA